MTVGYVCAVLWIILAARRFCYSTIKTKQEEGVRHEVRDMQRSRLRERRRAQDRHGSAVMFSAFRDSKEEADEYIMWLCSRLGRSGDLMLIFSYCDTFFAVAGYLL